MEKKTLGELNDNDLGCYIEVWFNVRPGEEEPRCAGAGILLNYEHTTHQAINIEIPATLFVISGRVTPMDMVSYAKVQVFNRDNDGNLS